MFVHCHIAVATDFMSLDAFTMATYQPCIKPADFTFKAFISNALLTSTSFKNGLFLFIIITVFYYSNLIYSNIICINLSAFLF